MRIMDGTSVIRSGSWCDAASTVAAWLNLFRLWFVQTVDLGFVGEPKRVNTQVSCRRSSRCADPPAHIGALAHMTALLA
jgi:hypothetical protein